MRPALWSPPSPLYAELNQHLWQRTRLIRLHTALANRCRTSAYRYTYSPTVAARDTALLHFVQRQIDSIDRACVRLLNQEPACAATAQCIVTIPGVGMTTAVWLICLTHNFTTCTSPKQLASFIGLVPHRRQSGTSLNTYTAVGHVGHDAIRQHLYIATLSCLRYNPVIKAFYDQLKARRYSHKLACVAATRKLLHIIWAVATKHTTFDPDYARKLTERA